MIHLQAGGNQAKPTTATRDSDFRHGALKGQNEILDIVRRIDAAEEAEAFELVELDDDATAP